MPGHGTSHTQTNRTHRGCTGVTATNEDEVAVHLEVDGFELHPLCGSRAKRVPQCPGD